MGGLEAWPYRRRETNMLLLRLSTTHTGHVWIRKNRVRRRWNSQLNRRQAVITTKCGSGVGRNWSLFLLLAERRYGNGFLDMCKTGNLRGGSFKLNQRHIFLTTKPLKEWFPDWIKVMEPPVWRCIFYYVFSWWRSYGIKLWHEAISHLILMRSHGH